MWRRANPHISVQDILMRMQPDTGQRSEESDRRVKNSMNMLRSRPTAGFDKFRMVAWFGTGASGNVRERVLASMTEAQRLLNTTRGSTPGLINPDLGECPGNRVALPKAVDGERKCGGRQPESPENATPVTAAGHKHSARKTRSQGKQKTSTTERSQGKQKPLPAKPRRAKKEKVRAASKAQKAPKTAYDAPTPMDLTAASDHVPFLAPPPLRREPSSSSFSETRQMPIAGLSNFQQAYVHICEAYSKPQAPLAQRFGPSYVSKAATDSDWNHLNVDTFYPAPFLVGEEDSQYPPGPAFYNTPPRPAPQLRNEECANPSAPNTILQHVSPFEKSNVYDPSLFNIDPVLLHWPS